MSTSTDALTIDQIRAALTRGDVSVRRDPDGTITAVKVAPFDPVTYQAAPFADCPLPLFMAALVGDACVGRPGDRPWAGSWWPLYAYHIWQEPPEED